MRKNKLNKRQEKFKHACPNCKVQDKLVVKCLRCLKYICIECSINDLCIDCHVDYSAHINPNEIDVYFADKYSEGIIC